MENKYLLIYDISDSKNYRKLYKILGFYNFVRIQKSLLEISEPKVRVMKLCFDIQNNLDVDNEKIAIIPLCSDDYKMTESFGLILKTTLINRNFRIL
ncbi:MAG: CRISPR-associated endonuclease Cas2 [Bacilli bacterium]